MSTKQTEALQLALEWDKRRKYIMPYVVRDAIREALAEQPEDYEELKNQRDRLIERVAYLEEQRHCDDCGGFDPECPLTKPAQQQEPVALPEKMYEFVPTPEPIKWHHPECEGQCIACLIEQVVQEAYGSQGLGYLQRHLTSPPNVPPARASNPWAGLTDEEIVKITADPCLYIRGGDYRIDISRAIEAKLREKNA